MVTTTRIGEELCKGRVIGAKTHVPILSVLVLHLKVAKVEVECRHVGIAGVDHRAHTNGKELKLAVLGKSLASANQHQKVGKLWNITTSGSINRVPPCIFRIFLDSLKKYVT